MTNEQAYVILENCANLLDSGTRFFTEDHVKQFHEAYELAMKTLRKTEPKRGRWEDCGVNGWRCSNCRYEVSRYNNTAFCPSCGAAMQEDDNV